MTAREVNRAWKETMPKGTHDYWSAQLDWTQFVDSLNRNGDITDYQRDRIQFPYKYGKAVVIK